MSLLGFDAIGRWALGKPPNSSISNANVTQASGTGVAGSLTASVNGSFTGVAGVGVADGIASSAAKLLIGVSGTGRAGSLAPSVAATVSGAVGAGAAGIGIAGLIGASPPAARGIGIAGSLYASIQAFFQGVSGTGVAGQFRANPGGNFSGAYGTGIAGNITITISGGGGNGASAGDGNRPRRKPRTGLEPVLKAPPAKPTAPKPILLPPEWLRNPTSPPLAPGLPAEETDPAFIAAMPQLAQAIAEAHIASDHNYDEQDMADIADVLAALD